MAKLTDKQERFVQELVKGKSQREAYKVAYSDCKASDKTIDEYACRLIKQDKVLARYRVLHDRLMEEAEKECIISAKEVLQELKRIGFSDITQFLSYKTVKTVVAYDKDTGEPIIDYVPVVEFLDSGTVDGRVISEISVNAKGGFSFKLHDKMAALDKLGKHLGLFAEKLEVRGTLNNPFEGFTTEQLMQLLNED